MKAAEFLDIEVQQVAGERVFVAADGRRRVEGTETSKALAAEVPPDDIGSTLRRQLGILMDIHSVLLVGNFVLDTLSFLGRNQVNNLLKDHG